MSAILLDGGAAPAHENGQDDGVDAALRRAGQLVATASGLALALDQVGIELPPMHASQVDAAQLRAIASLYLASELENTGLITTVETLASLMRSGAITADVGAATPLLLRFWQERNQRASHEERMHSYGALFGATGSGSFDEAMLALCEALYKLDLQAVNPTYGGMAQQAVVRSAASALLDLLLANAGGITVFLAQEILHSVSEALAVLKQHALQAAFGARDVWSAIEQIGRLTHMPHADTRLYVQRGKAGMTVLAWLADIAPQLALPNPPMVGLDHPVIGAAQDWMQAALAIGEAAAAAPAPAAPATPASPWAALAA